MKDCYPVPNRNELSLGNKIKRGVLLAALLVGYLSGCSNFTSQPQQHVEMCRDKDTNSLFMRYEGDGNKHFVLPKKTVSIETYNNGKDPLAGIQQIERLQSLPSNVISSTTTINPLLGIQQVGTPTTIHNPDFVLPPGSCHSIDSTGKPFVIR